MQFLYVLFEWLLVLALLGLVGVLGWMTLTVLHLKNAVMQEARRIYERPLRSVKNLAATGKGIAQQETARAKRMGTTVKGTTEVVKDTALGVKEAAQSIHPSDLKPLLTNIQSVLKMASAAAEFARSVSQQGEARV